MDSNIYGKELVQLLHIAEDDPFIERKRLRNGDIIVRNAIGESLTLVNGVQILIRNGYFSISSAQELTVERRKDGSTSLRFSSGDELIFNDDGIQSLKREMFIFLFRRNKEQETRIVQTGTAFTAVESLGYAN